MEYWEGEVVDHELRLLDVLMGMMFLGMLIQEQLWSNLSAELKIKKEQKGGLHIFRGSSNGRFRFGGASFSDGDVYEDKGRAG